MPAILTHDFFGKDAFGSALEFVDLYTPDERNAFLLGSQGPDPLFYLLLLPPLADFRRFGSDMHHMSPTKLFLALRRAVDALPESDRGVGRAYLAGFTCHYVLDRAVHPLVYFWERGVCQAGVKGLDYSDGGAVHAEIERDLDEMVLFVKRNQTVETYRPYREVLRGSDEMLGIVGEVYRRSALGPFAADEPTTQRVYLLAVLSFRVVQDLFWSPKGTKTNVLARIEAPILHQRYSLVRSMSHRVRAELTSDFDNRLHSVWKNPFTHEVQSDSFWDLYNGALDELSTALAIVFEDDFDEEAALAFTRGLNFCGERVE